MCNACHLGSANGAGIACIHGGGVSSVVHALLNPRPIAKTPLKPHPHLLPQFVGTFSFFGGVAAVGECCLLCRSPLYMLEFIFWPGCLALLLHCAHLACHTLFCVFTLMLPLNSKSVGTPRVTPASRQHQKSIDRAASNVPIIPNNMETKESSTKIQVCS